MIEPGLEYFRSITSGEQEARLLQGRYKLARGGNGV